MKSRGCCAWNSNPGPQDARMVGADKSTELWWPPRDSFLILDKTFSQVRAPATLASQHRARRCDHALPSVHPRSHRRQAPAIGQGLHQEARHHNVHLSDERKGKAVVDVEGLNDCPHQHPLSG